MSKLRITPIGTCRIVTPLKRASARYPILPDLRRNYGYVHTSAEALQQLRFLFGEKRFAPEVLSLVMRSGDGERYEEQSWDPADLHIVEVSSAKRLTCGSDEIQLNYLSVQFADFFASPERSRRYWHLLRHADRKELVAFLGEQPSFRMLSKERREILLNIRIEHQTFNSVKADLAEMVERLGRDRVLLLTHINAQTPDGNVIPSRDRLIRWVKVAGKDLGVPCFDPTDYLAKFGQERALEKGGLDLTHYTPAFSDHIYDALHRSHLTSLLSGTSESQNDPDRHHAMLAAQFEAMLAVDEFVPVARKIMEAARLAPHAVPLIELRGLVRAEVGDYELALKDLSRRDDIAMSQRLRQTYLQALHQTGHDERALDVAERLISDEYEDAAIHRVAFEAAERLGRTDVALVHAKQAFRLERRDVGSALQALTILKSKMAQDEVANWRSEIFENAHQFENGTFELGLWAIRHGDDEMFRAAFPALAGSDRAAAIDLVEEAINKEAFASASLGLHELAAGEPLPRPLLLRTNEAAIRLMDVAEALLADGRALEALEIADAAGLFRPATARSRVLIRSVANGVRSNIRDAYAVGDHQRVVDSVGEMTNVVVTHVRTALLLARSLAALGRPQQALDLLREADHHNPGDFALRRWAGRIALQMGDLTTALRMYGTLDQQAEAFEAVRPEYERFFETVERRSLKLLRELLQADRIDDAFELLDELKARTGGAPEFERELARKHRELRLKLVEIDQGDRDIEQRGDILRAMLRIKPDDASALRRLALEYMREMRFSEAAAAWERLRAQDPENETATRNRERCEVLAKRLTNSAVRAAA